MIERLCDSKRHRSRLTRQAFLSVCILAAQPAFAQPSNNNEEGRNVVEAQSRFQRKANLREAETLVQRKPPGAWPTFVPVPTFSWAGFYVGVNAGLGVGSTSPSPYFAAGLPSGGFDLNPVHGSSNGFTGGGQIGNNWQFNSFVVGLEMDFNYLGDRPGPAGMHAAPAAFTSLGAASCTIETGNGNYFGSLGGRVGYAFDRTLAYVTGGIALGGSRGEASLSLVPGGPDNQFTAGKSFSSQPKFIVGGGLEYAFAEHWSARAEYLYVDLARNTQLFENSGGLSYTSYEHNRNHVLRLGLNYWLADHGSPDAPASDAGAAVNQDKPAAPVAPENYSAHSQITEIPQLNPSFPAAYSGPHSFRSKADIKESFSATAFFGLRLWDGAAAYVNPEANQGFGLSNTLGIAGFPNNEAFKVGSTNAYLRFQRYFIRQTIGLGGATEWVDAAQNQLAGPLDNNRLTFTVGKYAVTDIFDDNKYAHDGRNGFMNWTINTMGAFDFAADSWGYTVGGAAEWQQDWWTGRLGIFQMSKVPNGEEIDLAPFQQFESVAEFEERHTILEQPGKLKFLAYSNGAFMGSYDQAVALAAGTGSPPDISATRAKRFKAGGGINLEQKITPDVGFFARFSYATGHYETFEFTEVERSTSAGMVVNGAFWGRSGDQIGLGGVINGISNSHANYLGQGGLGIILGDGALSYSGERILEAYYRLGIVDGVHATADYQFVENPGYNLARGPVSLLALRLHAEF